LAVPGTGIGTRAPEATARPGPIATRSPGNSGTSGTGPTACPAKPGAEPGVRAAAKALCPRYPLMAKRPPLGTEYYESFNRDNVSLVDVSASPIGGITATGIRVADRTG